MTDQPLCMPHCRRESAKHHGNCRPPPRSPPRIPPTLLGCTDTPLLLTVIEPRSLLPVNEKVPLLLTEPETPIEPSGGTCSDVDTVHPLLVSVTLAFWSVYP
jgi:hypothetical protein